MKKVVLVLIICMSFISNVKAQRERTGTAPVEVISADELVKSTSIDLSEIMVCGPAKGKIQLRGLVGAGVSGLTKSGFGLSDTYEGVETSPQFSSILGLYIKGNVFNYDLMNFETGISFETQGAKLTFPDIDDAEYKLNLLYLKIPAIIEYSAGKYLSFFGGPQLGFLLSAKQEYLNDEKRDVKEEFKTLEFSGVLGAGYKVYCKEKIAVDLGVRYEMGFSDINDIDGGDKVKNSGLTGFISIHF